MNRFPIARLLLFTLCLSSGVSAQQVIPLYPGAIPNSRSAPDLGYTDAEDNAFKVSTPELIAFWPARAAGAEGKTRGRGAAETMGEAANKPAVIICPGGGYGALVMDREGYRVAKALNKQGMACFVLEYRLPDTATMIDPSLGPIEDAQMAIKTVRENALKWKIDPHRIGMMGFSAGGHLAATAGTHFDKNYIENNQNTSLRPDFLILVYPVITLLDSLTHQGSKQNLLGSRPTMAAEDPMSAAYKSVLEFSNELHITAKTPPTFLLHASDDEMVPVGNSLLFYEGCLKQGVPAGLHIFPAGRHGFLAEPAKTNWLHYSIAWLSENGFIR